jgi:SAM-dependent methyltransferase
MLDMAENDFAVKAGHRAMWMLGDYSKVARDVLSPLGREVVEACGIRPGQRVLDVAAGSGNAAIPAAEAGATVVASDLAPELLDVARQEAAGRGVRLKAVEADAELLPFDDDEFDVVMSCIGAMFAPHHQRVADEMVRVSRPGGTIGMINWAVEGSIAEFLQVFVPYLPPLPPGASPPVLWGDAGYVSDLFGDRVEGFEMSPPRSLRVDHFADPAEFCAYYKAHFGPTIAAYAGIAADPERVAALDRDFLEYARRRNRAPAGSPAVFGYDYVVVTARKRTG